MAKTDTKKESQVSEYVVTTSKVTWLHLPKTDNDAEELSSRDE